MPRNCSTAICLILALCIATPCLGAGNTPERRIKCGEYSYILPEGFTAFDMPQPSNTNNVYLMTRDNPVGHMTDAGVTCIVKQKEDNTEYLLDSAKVIYESPKVKHAIRKELVRFNEEIKPGMRVYHGKWFYENLPKELQSANWSIFCVEMMNDNTSNTHVILYFWSWSDYKKSRMREKKTKLTDTEIKDRALKFIYSIKNEK